jgi:hypothetical protein
MANIKQMMKHLPLHFENAKCSSFTYALVFCFVAAEVAKKGLTHHKVPHKSSK